MTTAQTASNRKKRPAWVRYLVRYKWLYIMLIPVLAYYAIFHYAPMYGATIAFKKFNIIKGIMKSPWIGFDNFTYLFALDKFKEVTWNTLWISTLRLTFGFPFPIIIALLMNEVRSTGFKRTVQTVVYLPHFISWVILGGILVNMLSIDGGVVNECLKYLGFKPIGFLSDSEYFVGTMVVSMIWKEFGWSTIIYMAALSGVDPQLYEAARVDGASRFRQLISISLPGISGAIVVVLILRLGSMMQAGFEQIFVLYNPSVYKVADIIDTFVYRLGLEEGKFALASAVGLFKSLINFVLLVTANMITRSMGKEGVF